MENPSEKKKPTFDMIKECSIGINTRIEALGIKGITKQANEAIAYACGFATALNLSGFDTTPLAAWIQFDLAFHGMLAVKRVISL